MGMQRQAALDRLERHRYAMELQQEVQRIGPRTRRKISLSIGRHMGTTPLYMHTAHKVLWSHPLRGAVAQMPGS